MTDRPDMRAEDWAVSAMLLGAGLIVGLILGMLVAMMIGGLWVLVLIGLPLLIIQFVFEAGIAGLWALARRRFGSRGDTVTPPAPVKERKLPWVRDHAFITGLGAAVLAVLLFGPGFP